MDFKTVKMVNFMGPPSYYNLKNYFLLITMDK